MHRRPFHRERELLPVQRRQTGVQGSSCNYNIAYLILNNTTGLKMSCLPLPTQVTNFATNSTISVLKSPLIFVRNCCNLGSVLILSSVLALLGSRVSDVLIYIWEGIFCFVLLAREKKENILTYQPIGNSK